MFRRLIPVIVTLLLVVNVASAKDEKSVRLRVMQLSYITQNGVIDVQIDGTVVLERLSWPFATDYLALAPGTHQLTTFISDKPDSSASTSLVLEVGHSYSVIVDGDYADRVNYVVLNETNLSSQATGSSAFVINLTSEPITNITANDEVLIENIPPGDYRLIGLPETEFTLAGKVGERSYSETYTPHANTLFLVVVRLTPSGDLQVIYHRSSPLTIAGYLKAVGNGAQFSQVAAVIGRTDLLDSVRDDGQYTLFLPTDQVLTKLVIPTEASQVRDLLSRHVIAQNLPPYHLPKHDNLTTLAGSAVSLNFGSTASGYWEIEGAPVLWDIRLANGVIYAIDGVINSSR